MEPLSISEESITGEIEAFWEFLGKYIDWEDVSARIPYVKEVFDGINYRLDGMGFEEKKMIHALTTLGFAAGGLINSKVYIMHETDGPIGEVN